MTDAGVLRDYKIEVAINNQHQTIDQLENLVNRKIMWSYTTILEK
jgi:hypothetical protein